MARKTSRGRQRIPLQKMKNESSLQVTFSKRRAGIMKKCNELSTLTGAQMAFVVFSPGNKAYSFGSPCVETVLNRFQNKIPNDAPQPEANSNPILTERLIQIHQEDKLKAFHAKIEQLKEENEAERKVKKTMDQISEIEENIHLCLEGSAENISLEQLEKLKHAFHELSQNAENKMKKVDIQEIQNVSQQPPMPTFADYGVVRNAFGFSSQGFAGASSFGTRGAVHFNPGGASTSGSANNGAQMSDPMVAPTVGSSVLQPYYGAAQGYGPLF